MTDVMQNPFDECNCSTTKALEALLNGTTRERCPTHEADLIEADRVAAERAELEHRRNEAAVAWDGIRREGDVKADARNAAKSAAERKAALAEMDPLLASLYEIGGAEIPPANPNLNTPVGDDAAFAQILGNLGFTVHSSETN